MDHSNSFLISGLDDSSIKIFDVKEVVNSGRPMPSFAFKLSDFKSGFQNASNNTSQSMNQKKRPQSSFSMRSSRNAQGASKFENKSSPKFDNKSSAKWDSNINSGLQNASNFMQTNYLEKHIKAPAENVNVSIQIDSINNF